MLIWGTLVGVYSVCTHVYYLYPLMYLYLVYIDPSHLSSFSHSLLPFSFAVPL